MKLKTLFLVLAVFSVAVVIVFKMATRLPQAPEHQVFIDGNILTMNAQNRIVEALSVRGDKIEALGSSAEILKLVGDATVVTNLRGRTLMPGFIDAHGHFPGSSLAVINADLNSPPLGSRETMADIIAALKGQAEKTAAGAWVNGVGYDDTLLAEKRHPTRAELDEVSLEHPVVAVHISGHMVVANSMALELAGISADTEDPEGGVIGRRKGSREPNGLLEETAQWDVVRNVYDVGLVDAYKMMKMAAAEYAAAGVTTGQSGGVDERTLSGVKMSIALGVVPIRMVLFPFQMEFGEDLINGNFNAAEYGTERMTIGPVKIVADGSIQGYTGYLSQPYHVPYHGDEQYAGYAAVPRNKLFEQVETLHKAGYQLAIHTNGDQSVEDALDAFEAAQKLHRVEDPRLILIHAQMAREDQIKRMKTLGVTPSFFSAHTWYWGDRHRDIFMGQKRAANMSPAKWAEESGLRYSSHLDTPVTPMLPLQAVWSTVHRITYAGDVLGPEQRVGVMEALRAVTIDAAWQVFEDDNRGSLEPGKYADMIILSASPLDEPMAMRELKVERTMVGGATIYQLPQ